MPANPGAMLAMFHIMFFTLYSAGFTYIRTELAYCIGVLAAIAHQVNCSLAYSSTFQVQPDAIGHHINILFLQAGTCTMITRCQAFEAGVDTTFISHVHSLKFDSELILYFEILDFEISKFS
jgi:hypothetical protein